MENELDQKNCRNCFAEMPPEARYCANCSQKYTTGRITFKDLCVEFFTQYLNLDSKLFRTAFALFIPGKLTIEYFKGRHKTYASPLRLFIVSMVFLFAYVSIQISKSNMDEGEIMELKEDIDWLDFRDRLEKAKLKTDSIFPQSRTVMATDSLLKFTIAGKENVRDSTKLGGNINGFELPNFSKRDLLNDSPDELVEKYAKDWKLWQIVVFRQAVKLKGGVKGVIEYFISKLGITLLLMMPFLALGLKLLYFRREYYYVEHLIFAFHFHAFLFLLILLLALLGPYLHGAIIGITILAMFVYLYIAMLRVYRQGWFKTWVKYMTLLGGYMALAIFFSALAFVVSFILF